MHYILAADACRRFVTGFTIEKDTMALWHGSRSAFLKCKFNYKEVSNTFMVGFPSLTCVRYLQEPELLVHLFIAFAFAFALENGQETG